MPFVQRSGDGSFSGAENVECTDDDAALARVAELLGRAPAEVWQAARLVAIVNQPPIVEG